MAVGAEPNAGLNRTSRDKWLGIRGKVVDFAIAAGGSNVCEVTLSVENADGEAVHGLHTLTVWLSDSKDGKGITSTSASGTVTAKSASGTVLGAITSKKVNIVQTLHNGTFILEITDSAKTTFYVAAQTQDGNISVSRILATADYG